MVLKMKPIFCAKCGAENEPEMKFCVQCGARLSSSKGFPIWIPVAVAFLMATGACVLLIAIGATVLLPWLGKVAMPEAVAERTFEAGTAIDWDTGIGLKVSVPQSSTERKVTVRRSTPEQPREDFISFHSVYDITLGSDSKPQEKLPVTLSFQIPDGVVLQAAVILYWTEEGWAIAENKQGDPGGTVSADGKYISITREGASRHVVAEWLYKNILRHFDNLPEPPPASPIIQVKGTQPSPTYPGYLVSEVTLDSPVVWQGLGGTWYQIDVSGKDHVKLEGAGYLAPGTKQDLKIIFPGTGGQARVCLNTKGALARAALDWADRLGLPTEDAEFLVEIVERFQDRPANWWDLIWLVKNRLVDLIWKALGAEIKFYANLIPVSIDIATYINAVTDSRPDSCVDVNTSAITTLPPSPGPTITSVARPSITPTRTSTPRVTRTQVITVTPKGISGKEETGYCWTRSILLPYRRDAWRCMVDHSITDPCFSIAGDNRAVICAGLDGIGPKINLTEVLPTSEGVLECPSCAWRLELTDGAICSRDATGTSVFPQGFDITWACSNDWFIVGQPVVGQIWTAQTLRLSWSGASPKVTARGQVTIKTVWR
jgi:hypothetical protein